MNNPHLYPHPSRRVMVYGNRGIAATSTPAAAQAGLDIMKAGGNAVDAAIAMAMTLTVVEPVSNGIGGDAFAILWHKGKMYGLNASGPAPASISGEKIIELGNDKMPETGFIPVTLPGAPSAWAALSKEFGRIPLAKTAEPAIDYAVNGFPLSPAVSEAWRTAAASYKRRLDPKLFQVWADTFLKDGNVPATGQTMRLPYHGRTLKEIAESGGEAFYKGHIAEEIDDYFRVNGGFLTKEDLAAYNPQWVEPIKASFRGHDIWEIPPNGQGLVALIALSILDGMDLRSYGDPVSTHRIIEAIKLAFTDGQRYIADPEHMPLSVERLLSKELIGNHRGRISEIALDPETVPFIDHGTVYLCAADGEGTMISYIQSNYMGFGSGIVIPGRGISMQNRGANFSLNPAHPNCIAPGKRPYHTIIPGFLTKDGNPLGPFGVMGGFMQPQGHVQVIVNMLEYGMNPQAALDAPRWQWTKGKGVSLELESPQNLGIALRQMGHEISYPPNSGSFGRGQIIFKDASGALAGASEPRCDGIAAAW